MAPECLTGVVGIDARVDLETAAVGVVGGERVHIVGQAGILADAQEQPARRTIAEHGAEQLQRPGVRMVALQGGYAEAEMGLRAGSLDDLEALAGRQRRGCRGPRQADAIAGPKGPCDEADRLVVGQVAGQRHDRVGRLVGIVPEATDGVRLQAADSRLVAGDLPAERRVAEKGLVEDVEDQLPGVVAVRADLLDDDLALAVDLVVGQERADDELGQDVHGASGLSHR